MKALLILASLISINSYAAGPLELPLRGQGEYKIFLLSIYDAKLWAERAEDIYAKPLSLELKYKRTFKGKDIADRSIKEIISAGHSKSEVEEWRQRLTQIFPDVKDGDTILANFNPEKGIVFYLNTSKELGQLSDLSFSKKFLDIWLGEKTSAPDLRAKLLGEKE